MCQGLKMEYYAAIKNVAARYVQIWNDLQDTSLHFSKTKK